MQYKNIIIIIFASIALTILGVIIVKGVMQPQNAKQSKADEGWTQIEDTDSKITYYKPECWEMKNKANSAANHPEYDINYRGGTIRQSKNAGTSGCSAIGNGDYNTYIATLNTTGTGIKFDKIRVGYRKWTYGPPTENVLVDGQQNGQINAKDNDFNYNYTKDAPWESSQLSCGEHKIDLKLGSSGNFGLDFIDVHICSGSSDTTVSTNCQGNGNASAKCFDCYKDTSGDQINMLDYACFVKFYNVNVGKQ